LSALKSGFFLRKKPLECALSVYSNSENAMGPYACEDVGEPEFPSNVGESPMDSSSFFDGQVHGFLNSGRVTGQPEAT